MASLPSEQAVIDLTQDPEPPSRPRTRPAPRPPPPPQRVSADELEIINVVDLDDLPSPAPHRQDPPRPPPEHAQPPRVAFDPEVQHVRTRPRADRLPPALPGVWQLLAGLPRDAAVPVPRQHPPHHHPHHHHHHPHHHHPHHHHHHHHHHHDPLPGGSGPALTNAFAALAARFPAPPESLGLGLPGQLDYQTPAFALGVAREPAPRPASAPVRYPSPGPARPGFTRSPGEHDVLACPNCERELGAGDEALRRQIWVVRSCGHVYCGECAKNRQKKTATKAPRPSVCKPFSKCVVDGCGKTKISNPKAMFQIYT